MRQRILLRPIAALIISLGSSGGLEAHQPVTLKPRCVLPEGAYLTALSNDGSLAYLFRESGGQVEIWDTLKAKLHHEVEHKELTGDRLVVSSEGGFLAATLRKHQGVLLVNLKTGKKTVIEKPAKLAEGHVLHFSDDERYFAVANQGILRVFESASTRQLNTLDYRLASEKNEPHGLRYAGFGIGRFSADGKYFFQWTRSAIAAIKLGASGSATYFRDLFALQIALS